MLFANSLSDGGPGFMNMGNSMMPASVYDFGNMTYNPAGAQTGALSGGNFNFGNYGMGGGGTNWMAMLQGMGALGSAMKPQEKPPQPQAPAFRSAFKPMNLKQYMLQAQAAPTFRGLLG